MWHDGDWGGWNWMAMSLMMVLFWGALIALIVWLVRETSGPRSGGRVPPQGPNAEELLAQRFARGEIDAEEFTRRRAALREADRA